MVPCSELGNNTEIGRLKVNIGIDSDRKKVVELGCIETILTAGKDQLFAFELLQGKAFFFCQRMVFIDYGNKTLAEQIVDRRKRSGIDRTAGFSYQLFCFCINS